ncbi:MAG: toxin-antitoxin system YwqK family antitoxin [Planctomycetota bacterium]
MSIPSDAPSGKNRRLPIRTSFAVAAGLIVAAAFVGKFVWDRVSVYTYAYVEEPTDAIVAASYQRWGSHQDEPHGEFRRWWWLGGPLESTGHFENGREVGWWRFYDESGMLLYRRFYRKGELLEHRWERQHANDGR